MKKNNFNAENTNIWNATFNCPFCSTKILNYYQIAETSKQTITCSDCKNKIKIFIQKHKNNFALFIVPAKKEA